MPIYHENSDKKTIDLSIITICFNSAKTINKTFDSILNQNMKPFECIIIDAGSTDGTIELIKSFIEKAPFLVKIISGKDRGISDAFNRGVITASSNWLHILNSDDYYLDSEVLNKLLSVFSSTSAGIIFCGGVFEQINSLPVPRYGRLVNGTLQYSMTAIHPSCFVRREVYDKVGYFSESFRTSMDYEWLSRVERILGNTVFQEVNLLTTFIGDGGESVRNRRRGFREVASAQLVNTNISVLYILCRYFIYCFLFCTKFGKIFHKTVKLFKN